MINLKESCRKCQKLDRCIKAVAHNINNRFFLPFEKKWVNCVDFAQFESVVEDYVMYSFQEALSNYYKESRK